MRKTRKTMRRLPATARELVKLANELDRLSRRAMALAVKVEDAERDSEALQSMMSKFGGDS